MILIERCFADQQGQRYNLASFQVDLAVAPGNNDQIIPIMRFNISRDTDLINYRFCADQGVERRDSWICTSDTESAASVFEVKSWDGEKGQMGMGFGALQSITSPAPRRVPAVLDEAH
jgi:hypothetical protein